jgi:hypothetical protein
MANSYIKAKNPARKAPMQNAYKELRNKVVELTRKSKLLFYTYFSANSKNLRKVWQCIKSLINIKSRANDVPTYMYDDKGNLSQTPFKSQKRSVTSTQMLPKTSLTKINMKVMVILKDSCHPHAPIPSLNLPQSLQRKFNQFSKN